MKTHTHTHKTRQCCHRLAFTLLSLWSSMKARNVQEQHLCKCVCVYIQVQLLQIHSWPCGVLRFLPTALQVWWESLKWTLTGEFVDILIDSGQWPHTSERLSASNFSNPRTFSHLVQLVKMYPTVARLISLGSSRKEQNKEVVFSESRIQPWFTQLQD